jgi:hypothetical protein
LIGQTSGSSADYVLNGSLTQTDTFTYLNRNSANPVLQVAQVGAGDIARFYKTGSLGSTTYDDSFVIGNDGSVTVESSTGDAALYLKADTSNTVESSNPFIRMEQDGNAVATVIGSSGTSGVDAQGNVMLNAGDNGFNIHMLWASGTIGLGVGGDTALRIEADNDLYAYKNATVAGQLTLLDGSYALKLQSTAPKLWFHETDATADNGKWDIVAAGEQLRFRTGTDAESFTDWMVVDRTGATRDNVAFRANGINFATSGNSTFHQFYNGYAEGRYRIYNGSNWGLIMKGAGNDPQIGAYGIGGSLSVVAWGDSVGSTLDSSQGYSGTMQKWNFGTQRTYFYGREHLFQDSHIVHVPTGVIGNDVLHVGIGVKGGGFDSTTSTQTGYCIVGWGPSVTNDSVMMSALIHGYNYSGTNGDGDGGYWCVAVSGYAYSTENWHNTSARIITGSPPFDIVQFGESETGDHKYILLGISTTSWDYPKVWITNVMTGHSTQYTDMFSSADWTISFSASTPSGWAEDASATNIYIGGQIRWDGDSGTSANDKNLGGRVTISTAAASGGYDGDIHFKY